MDATSSQALNRALIAPPVGEVGAVQLGLLGDDGAKPTLQRQASAPAANGAGRPAGSVNKFQKDLVKLVTHKLGRHPIEEMVNLYQLPLEKLGLEFGTTTSKAGAIKERLLAKLVEHTTPKVAQINVNQQSRVQVIFGDLGADFDAEFDDDDVIDVASNENNDLAGGEG